MEEITSIEGWKDVTFAPAPVRAGPKVIMSQRVDLRRGKTETEISMNEPLLEVLGWPKECRVRVKRSDDFRFLALTPGDAGKKVKHRARSCSIRHRLGWAPSDANRQAARPCEYRIVGTALILTLPAWAVPADGEAKAARPPKPVDVPARQPAPPPPPLTAAPALVRAEDTVSPPQDDLDEAAVMVRQGQGAAALVDYFGWDGDFALDFAKAERAKMVKAA